MTKIKITQVKSGIDRPERQKLTLRALGLNKLNASREVEASAQILGMVRKVNHLIKIEEVAGDNESTPVTKEAVSATTVEAPKVSAPVAAAPKSEDKPAKTEEPATEE